MVAVARVFRFAMLTPHDRHAALFADMRIALKASWVMRQNLTVEKSVKRVPPLMLAGLSSHERRNVSDSQRVMRTGRGAEIGCRKRFSTPLPPADSRLPMAWRTKRASRFLRNDLPVSPHINGGVIRPCRFPSHLRCSPQRPPHAQGERFALRFAIRCLHGPCSSNCGASPALS